MKKPVEALTPRGGSKKIKVQPPEGSNEPVRWLCYSELLLWLAAEDEYNKKGNP